MTISKKTLDLARQWVEDINASPWTLSPRTAAAADLIASLPDEWVNTNELRKYIHDWREKFATAPRGHYETEMLNELEALMPTPATPPTLADMSPEERAECQWMQCNVPALEEPGVILQIWGNGCNVVSRDGVVETEAFNHVTPRPDLPRMQWPGNEPEDPIDDLKDFRIVPLDLPERAVPLPEDVPVGEPWLLEVDEKVAIGYRNDSPLKDPWDVVYRDSASHDWLDDSNVTLIARLVSENAEQEGEWAETEEEYEALPEGSIVALDKGAPMLFDGDVFLLGDSRHCSVSVLAGTRRRVLRKGWGSLE